MVRPASALQGELAALEEGRAFVELPGGRAVRVHGADARGWLHALLTADVARLGAGASARALLLSPTGGIRADVTVVADRDGFILVQERDQPEGVDDLLAPYVLSSDVSLEDRSGSGVTVGLGPGRLLLIPAGDLRGGRARLAADGLAPVSREAWEIHRVRRGDPRFPRDTGTDALPEEAGLGHLVDVEKGCFLGQEAVARVRNLGHPRRLVLHLRAGAPLSPGSAVLSAGRSVGEVTSAAPGATPGTSVLLARVRWEAADAPLEAEGRIPLRRVDPRRD
jgi:hypothetical protein